MTHNEPRSKQAFQMVVSSPSTINTVLQKKLNRWLKSFPVLRKMKFHTKMKQMEHIVDQAFQCSLRNLENYTCIFYVVFFWASRRSSRGNHLEIEIKSLHLLENMDERRENMWLVAIFGKHDFCSMFVQFFLVLVKVMKHFLDTYSFIARKVLRISNFSKKRKNLKK